MSATAEPTSNPTAARLSAAEYAAAPDGLGRFGIFGGSYIPETLHHAVAELAEAYESAKADPSFAEQMDQLSRDFIGRATPLQFAERLTEHVGGAKIYFKREDLAHTGAHKINNAIGQCLLAIRMGKKRIIAETGAGQHGTATATAAARFGLECEIFMGAEDMRRQRPNVLRMELLGAKVTSVESGAKTLKDATNAAMRDWMASSADTHYIIGSVVGPHPFPMLVRDFQSVIGTEAKRAFVERTGGMPDAVVAVVGGGSNAAGMFYPFVSDAAADGVRIVGVEPGGTGSGTGQHAAAIMYGEPGVLHGSMSYVLQDPDGQTQPVHSISAGLDYPGIGPEHAWWHHTGRVEFVSVTDREALETFALLCRLEGIIPALEPSHAVCHATKLAKELDKDQTILVNLCGRGDKDLDEALRLMGEYGIATH